MSDNAHPTPVRPCRSIRFTEIPRTSALYADYLYSPDRVARFYEHPWEGVDGLVRLAPSIAASFGDREQLADALAHQNRSYGSSDLALEHVELLRRPDAVAVVTGQQAGLFGGPLFTVYKALTAISLAARLRERGVTAVPVFWIASEDHDFREVDHATVLNRDGDLETVRVETCALEPDMPVGHVALCAEITRTVDALFAALPETDFTKDLRAAVSAAYAPGSGFAEAFARWMARLFAPFGVVLLDPLAPALKELASPTYIKAIERAPEIARALVDRSRELVDAGYHAQVFTSADMTPLFITENQRRRAMTQHDGRFELKSGERVFEMEELLDLAENCATCLSPNVTLRPAVQDTLLPTVAYVGGPAEVAYFAQLQPVYHLVGRPMPVVVPRASATLLDHDSAKTIDRYGICLEDFFEGHEAVLRKIVEQSLDAPTAAVFDEVEARLAADLDRLREALERAEPTLAVSLEGGRRKMLYQLNKLRTRFVRAAASRDDVLHRRLAAAEALLFPGKALQERTLNVLWYLARTGEGLIEDLADAIDPESRQHQLIRIGGVASQVFARGSGARAAE
jgi:bacillithiol biosynthesis cysteine-adding enzyme BshC